MKLHCVSQSNSTTSPCAKYSRECMKSILLPVVRGLVGWFQRNTLIARFGPNRFFGPAEFDADNPRGSIFLGELFELAHVPTSPVLTAITCRFAHVLFSCPGLTNDARG